MAPILFATGFFSIFAQVILIRELNVAFYGNDLIYTLALGCWLFLTAIGAFSGPRRFVPSATSVCLLLLLFAFALPCAVVFIRGSHRIFGGIAGGYLPFALQLLSMTLGLLPIGVLLGLLFQWAAKSYVSGGKTLAVAYAIESAGGILGGVSGTVALKWGVQVLPQALVCSVLACVLVSTRYRGQTSRSLGLSGLVLSGLLVTALLFAGPLDRQLTSWTHPNLVATRDTPYGRVTITSSSGQIVVYANNALAYETEGTGAEEFVHLAALQSAAPRRVLILGGGAEGLVREVLKHRPDEVTYVDIDRRFVDLVTPYLPPEDRESLTASAVTIVIADPRVFLESGSRYDLILVGMPEPTSGQTGRYYSREFFEQCTRRLDAGGVLALRLRSSENLWTRHLTLRSTSIFNALRSVFEDAMILPGAMNILLASNRPLSRSPQVMVERFVERRIEASLVGPEYLDYVYTNDRLPQIQELVDQAPPILNTDARPIGYQYSQMLWLSQFFPSLADMDPTPMEIWGGTASLPRWMIVWAAVVAVFVGARRRRDLRRATLVAAAGFIGMVLESVLILNYQVRRGALYQDIGVLLTVFMAGLALGPLLTRGLSRMKNQRGFVTLRVGYPLSFAALSALAAWLVEVGAVGSLVSTGLCLLATGGLVGGVLAHVSLDGVDDQGQIIAPLYAADLLGGCVGSVVATLFLLPVLGLSLSCWSLSILGLTAVLLSAPGRLQI